MMIIDNEGFSDKPINKHNTKINNNSKNDTRKENNFSLKVEVKEEAFKNEVKIKNKKEKLKIGKKVSQRKVIYIPEDEEIDFDKMEKHDEESYGESLEDETRKIIPVNQGNFGIEEEFSQNQSGKINHIKNGMKTQATNINNSVKQNINTQNNVGKSANSSILDFLKARENTKDTSNGEHGNKVNKDSIKANQNNNFNFNNVVSALNSNLNKGDDKKMLINQEKSNNLNLPDIVVKEETKQDNQEVSNKQTGIRRKYILVNECKKGEKRK